MMIGSVSYVGKNVVHVTSMGELDSLLGRSFQS